MNLRDLNPADLEITQSEFEVYRIVVKLRNKGKTVTRADVSDIWGRSLSYTSRKLAYLVDRGLIERYKRMYYRLPN